jgi:hypothetical protein
VRVITPAERDDFLRDDVIAELKTLKMASEKKKKKKKKIFHLFALSKVRPQ